MDNNHVDVKIEHDKFRGQLSITTERVDGRGRSEPILVRESCSMDIILADQK